MAKPRKPRQLKTHTVEGQTLKLMRSNGFHGDYIGRNLPYSHIKKDYCGFADLLMFDQEGPVLVQCTTHDGGNMAARIRKCFQSQVARDWVQWGNRLLVLGWIDDQTIREVWLTPDHYAEYDMFNRLPTDPIKKSVSF